MALAIHCPNLTTIYLNGCINLTHLAIDAIATHCSKRLTTVGLGCCGKLNDAAATTLARHCPNLVTVVFEAQRAFRRCETVNYGISNAGEGGGSAKSKTKSKPLDETTHPYPPPNQPLTPGVIALATGCRHLTILSLKNCRNVTCTAIETLANRCPNLSVLSLGACLKIRDPGVLALARNCPHLTTIYLEKCRANITDAAKATLQESRIQVIF